MSRFVSRRTLAAASSLLLAAVGLTGCIRLPGGGGSNSTDIASMKNIPEGIMRDLISQMNSASGAEKNKIIEKRRPVQAGPQRHHCRQQGRQSVCQDVGRRLLAPR